MRRSTVAFLVAMAGGTAHAQGFDPRLIDEDVRRAAASGSPVAVVADCAARAARTVFSSRTHDERREREVRTAGMTALAADVGRASGADPRTVRGVVALKLMPLATTSIGLSPPGAPDVAGAEDEVCDRIWADPSAYLESVRKR